MLQNLGNQVNELNNTVAIVEDSKENYGIEMRK